VYQCFFVTVCEPGCSVVSCVRCVLYQVTCHQQSSHSTTSLHLCYTELRVLMPNLNCRHDRHTRENMVIPVYRSYLFSLINNDIIMRINNDTIIEDLCPSHEYRSLPTSSGGCCLCSKHACRCNMDVCLVSSK